MMKKDIAYYMGLHIEKLLKLTHTEGSLGISPNFPAV